MVTITDNVQEDDIKIEQEKSEEVKTGDDGSITVLPVETPAVDENSGTCLSGFQMAAKNQKELDSNQK